MSNSGLHVDAAWQCASTERSTAHGTCAPKVNHTNVTKQASEIHHIRVRNKDGSIKTLALEHSQYVTLMQKIELVQQQQKKQQQHQQQQQQPQQQQQQPLPQYLMQEQLHHPQQQQQPVVSGIKQHIVAPLFHNSSTNTESSNFVSDPTLEDDNCQRLDTMDDILSVMKNVTKDEADTHITIKTEEDAEEEHVQRVKKDLMNMLQGKSLQSNLHFHAVDAISRSIKTEPHDFQVLPSCNLSNDPLVKKEVPSKVTCNVEKVAGSSRQMWETQEKVAGEKQSEAKIRALMAYLQTVERSGVRSSDSLPGQTQLKIRPGAPGLIEANSTSSTFVTSSAKVGSLMKNPMSRPPQTSQSVLAQTSSADVTSRMVGYPQQQQQHHQQQPKQQQCDLNLSNGPRAPTEVRVPSYDDILPAVKLREAAFGSTKSTFSRTACASQRETPATLFANESIQSFSKPVSQDDVSMTTSGQPFGTLLHSQRSTKQDTPGDQSATASPSTEVTRQISLPLPKTFTTLVNIPMQHVPGVHFATQSDTPVNLQPVDQTNSNGWGSDEPSMGLLGGTETESGEVLMSMSTTQIMEYLKYNSMEVLDSASIS